MNSSVPKMSGIYKITCLPTEKIYIGSTNNLHKRWMAHKVTLRKGSHRNIYLQRAWNKHGEQSFIFEVIEYVMPFVLLEREQHWLDLLKPYDNSIGFNIANDASTPAHTAEVKARISKSHMGIKPNEETRKLMSLLKQGKPSPNKGKKFTPEHCANMSKAMLGNRMNLGRKHTEEHRAKNSAAKSKEYIIISPDGIEFKIKNMTAFCKEKNLNCGHMIQVALGNEKLHKGWSCKPC